jgi:hypothetical protein
MNDGYVTGTIWVDMDSGEAYIMIADDPGAAVWKQITNHTPNYKVGDIGPAGGIVFYVAHGGSHGLEAAPEDQSAAAEWGCYGAKVDGVRRGEIGTGALNTADIVAARCPPFNPDNGKVAAIIAHEYVLNGTDDWFLPSIDELDVLLANKNIMGDSTDNSNTYWSSSAISTNYGSALKLGNRTTLSRSVRYTTFAVRAIRAF